MSMDFTEFFFSLIIKINYPHLSGGPKGPPSPLQELEVGGRRPTYLLVLYTRVLGAYGPLVLSPAEGLGGPLVLLLSKVRPIRIILNIMLRM